MSSDSSSELWAVRKANFVEDRSKFGNLETNFKGWSRCIPSLLQSSSLPMIEQHFQNSFDHKIKKKLYLEDFWTNTDPRSWTITNYLFDLIAKDPAVTRRCASNRIIEDAKIIKEHVIAGTVAYTMANSLVAYNKNTRAKSAFNTFFDNHAAALSKENVNYRVQKTCLRSAMAEQVVDVEKEENKRKRSGGAEASRRSKRREVEMTDDSSQADNEEDNEQEEDKQSSIWEEWKALLNKQYYMQLSPEKHDVIWCGKLVRRREYLPLEFYTRINQEMPSITTKKISPSLIQMCMAIFDSSNNNEMQTNVDLLDRVELDEPTLVAEKKLVVDICKTLSDYIYDGNGLDIIQKSESCYRSYLFDSCIKFTTKYLRSHHHNISFLPGEIELDSMTAQLKQKGIDDRRFKYNADGIIKANDFSASEILLTEVSSGFNLNEKGKTSFDHYKAMFGMLAIIRTLAQLYNKASFDVFSKLKVHFLHAHGNAIRHWSMSTKAPGVYVMNKEQRVEVPAIFSQKDITLQPFICFYKTLAAACEETLSVLKDLKEDHKAALRSEDISRPSLSSTVDPVIIRLVEGKHESIVTDQGPISVPNSPSSSCSPPPPFYV